MRVSPSQVEAFLKARGWTLAQIDSFPTLFAFTHPAMAGRQLFLPKDFNAPDYGDAIHTLLTKLATIERIDFRTLADRLERTDAELVIGSEDSMALRVLKMVSSEDSIPLSLAHAIVRETETLLRAGSCTAENPQPFFRRVDNKISNDVCDRAVFNHTKRGSFILSISCPIAGTGEQLGFGFDPSQWTKSRRAFVAIYRGIRALTDAINSDELQRFSDEQLATEAPIVSSNFCQAFANIVCNDPGDGISVGFEWSPYIPLPPDISAGSSILVTPSMANGLYTISEHLRPKDSSVEDVFIGTVEALRGDVTNTGERAGAVEFSLLLKDGARIRATALLDVEQYKLADDAHIAGARYISISGKLEPHPRVWVFESVKSFSLVDG